MADTCISLNFCTGFKFCICFHSEQLIVKKLHVTSCVHFLLQISFHCIKTCHGHKRAFLYFLSLWVIHIVTCYHMLFSFRHVCKCWCHFCLFVVPLGVLFCFINVSINCCCLIEPLLRHFCHLELFLRQQYIVICFSLLSTTLCFFLGFNSIFSSFSFYW